MRRSNLIPAAIAVIFAIVTTGAAFASSSDKEKAGEVAAALSAKIPAVQAIAVAEQQTGGRALKIDVENEKGTYLYEIKTASRDKVAAVFVDPATGKVVRVEDEGLISRVFEREDRDAVAKLKGLQTTLGTAITLAEQRTDGKAIEAEYGDEDDRAVFEVEVAKDDALHKVEIDAASGEVTKVSPAEKN